jgi:hypothetical protein
MATNVGPIEVPPGLPGGNRAVLAVSAADVVKSSPGILCRILVTTSGNITINDANALSGSGSGIVTPGAGNQIFSGAVTASAEPLEYLWPCANGIVISAVSGGAVISLSYT